MGVRSFICPDDRPSPIWCLLGIALNCTIAGIGFAVSSDNKDRHEANGFTFYSDCRRPRTWIDYSALVAIANIIFLSHLANKIYRHKETKEPILGSPKADADRPVMKLLVYDIGVYIYTLFFIFVVVWSCIPADGPSWAGGSAPEYRLPACARYNDKVHAIRVLLWIYEGCCLLSIFIFLCCPLYLPTTSRCAKPPADQSRDCELSLMGYPCHYLEDDATELEIQ
eukprot:TRINITY_DN2122_c2_g3_i1.p1 TRINITY_DN2122_c2_g3~~TRINITY_DN2122_c2_g3_i1.p1  ORF type:complete len:236 (+),score=48.96 TRINITY_DN2122_c2_g3_i1:36-710(+)